jgi:hypothetical protein
VTMNPEQQMADQDEEIEADLSGVEGDFVFPDGDYPFRCIDVAVDYSKASGNKMYVWSFQGGSQLRGLTFKVFTALTPAAMWKLSEVIEAMGLGKKGEKVRFKKKDAIGKMVIGKLEKSEWEGQKRSSIAKVKPYVALPGTTEAGLPNVEKVPF